MMDVILYSYARNVWETLLLSTLKYFFGRNLIFAGLSWSDWKQLMQTIWECQESVMKIQLKKVKSVHHEKW